MSFRNLFIVELTYRSSLGLTCMPMFCTGETALVCTDETAVLIGTDETIFKCTGEGTEQSLSSNIISDPVYDIM